GDHRDIGEPRKHRPLGHHRAWRRGRLAGGRGWTSGSGDAGGHHSRSYDTPSPCSDRSTFEPGRQGDFFCCSAAASSQGTTLLNILSEIWRGRTVIASITKGYRFRTLTAGDISDTLLTVIEQVPSTRDYCAPGQSTH